jgi:hypothetical protein
VARAVSPKSRFIDRGGARRQATVCPCFIDISLDIVSRDHEEPPVVKKRNRHLAMLLLPLLYCFKGPMAMCSCKLLVCFVSCVRCTTANSSVCATFLFGTGPVVQACVVSVVYSWRGGAPRTSSCRLGRTAAMFAKMLASCGNDVGEAEPPAIVCTLLSFVFAFVHVLNICCSVQHALRGIRCMRLASVGGLASFRQQHIGRRLPCARPPLDSLSDGGPWQGHGRLVWCMVAAAQLARRSPQLAPLE